MKKILLTFLILPTISFSQELSFNEFKNLTNNSMNDNTNLLKSIQYNLVNTDNSDGTQTITYKKLNEKNQSSLVTLIWQENKDFLILYQTYNTEVLKDLKEYISNGFENKKTYVWDKKLCNDYESSEYQISICEYSTSSNNIVAPILYKINKNKVKINFK